MIEENIPASVIQLLLVVLTSKSELSLHRLSSPTNCLSLLLLLLLFFSSYFTIDRHLYIDTTC